MVCVLSVMNGFGGLVESMFSQFDPELKVVSAEGKWFVNPIPTHPELSDIRYSEVVEGQALAEYKEHRIPCVMMGVDEQFSSITQIDSVITDGFYSVYDGAFDRVVLGRGLADELGMNAHFVGGLHIYVPKRLARVNMLRPDESFNKATAYIAGEFAINQLDYDNQIMLVSLPLARRMLDYDSLCCTSLLIDLPEGQTVESVKTRLQSSLGTDFCVLDRYEQQEDFYRILRVEKLLTALLMIFILLVASFNIVGSLSMLIIDKREDIRILSHLGLSDSAIRRVFLFEGWMVSSLGAISGLVLGLVICLLQEHFGLLKLGTGVEYVISAYPVEVQLWDVLVVLVSVLVVGAVAAWIPSRKIRVAPALLLGLLFLVGCKPQSDVVYRPKLATEFTRCYIRPYGGFYPGTGSHVLMLDLYSEGLDTDSLGSLNGTGTNLCLTDVFVPVGAKIPPAGDYVLDTTAAPFSVLPGADYDGNPAGVYSVLVVDSEVRSVALYTDSTLTVSWSGDTLEMNFCLTQYHAHYRGVPVRL